MTQFSGTSGLKSALHGVLVIAQAGRMLAHAVRQAGYTPLVIDLYADHDTVTIAARVWQIKNLSLAEVQAAVANLLLNYKIQWIIYGSGLENYPETLEYLASCSHVTGSDFAIIRQLNAKQAFFWQLDTLGIQHPEVQFDPPGNNAGWLIKPVKHVGGLGIRVCNGDAKDSEYYQKFCTGKVRSALFCADGEQFQLIGFHRQWTVAEDNFAFAGMITADCLSVGQRQTVHHWLKKLVRFYSLKGLASLDFISNDQGCFMLEINPRPPASMMLYPEFDLLDAHRTGRVEVTFKDKDFRALQVVYASRPYKISPGVEWPEWSFDQPQAATCILVNQPICSIMARGKTAEQTLARLQGQQTHIENIILNR
ncbi:hypothetical protein BJAS_P0352 [Bathymodiolus japonicus methanotrophic gill symbiont]|uniref:ATP-grasp domain-containing protein n=1 Tax=Bathymodiolus japonicus methanotrophic gill symbiont TaxID=113269 RepID=UPI001B466D2C|nr:ATP-grasp domain-containing protein [Bathymodiolus japonicus methanotrophic gill symbiont]GFO71108.1 hypothetical protein BJAS_P0352 [Bathymodiolus japonicus methanotrophic gill symbiont]